MLNLSDIINNGLEADAAITAIFGDRIFPLLAPKNTPTSFITYMIKFLNSTSKDGVNEYEVSIDNYNESYRKCLEDHLVISAAMDSLIHGTPVTIYKFKKGVKQTLITEDEKQYYTNQIFNIQI